MRKKTLFALAWLVLAGAGSCFAQNSAPESLDSGRYARRLVAEHLDRPQAVVPLPGGAVLVAERAGRILLLDRGSRTDLGKITVPGLSLFYVPEPSYTEGLKDLIAVPDQPGVFLWGMTSGTAQACRWTIGRSKINRPAGQRPTLTSEILWQSDPQPWTRGSLPPFSGCRLLVDGNDLVVAMGASSRAQGFGRILRLSLTKSHAPQVVSTGHRNPSGVVRAFGGFWEVEHGPKGGDELNLIVAGSDYGWPAVSAGQPDDTFHPVGFTKSRPGSRNPVYAWTPAIAPSSLALWRGQLYVGTLQGGAVLQLTVAANQVVAQRRFLELGKRIRDVRAGYDDQSLWVLTDGPDAELWQVTPSGS